MRQLDVDTLQRYSQEIRQEGQGLVGLADEIDKHIPSLVGVGESNGKAHLTAEGLQRATEAARNAWHVCPRGCRKRDGVTPTKHRARHPHIRRAIATMPRRNGVAA